jgi:hypothetical protein
MSDIGAGWPSTFKVFKGEGGKEKGKRRKDEKGIGRHQPVVKLSHMVAPVSPNEHARSLAATSG